MLDTRPVVPTQVRVGKRSRSDYENGNEDVRPSADGSGNVDVEGLQWIHFIECLTNTDHRLLI
jgi:hypothetical protein